MSDQTPDLVTLDVWCVDDELVEALTAYDDRDMAEAYLAGYMAAEAVWTDGTERSVNRIEDIADDYGSWIEDYDAEVYPVQIDGSERGARSEWALFSLKTGEMIGMPYESQGQAYNHAEDWEGFGLHMEVHRRTVTPWVPDTEDDL